MRVQSKRDAKEKNKHEFVTDVNVCCSLAAQIKGWFLRTRHYVCVHVVYHVFFFANYITQECANDNNIS